MLSWNSNKSHSQKQVESLQENLTLRQHLLADSICNLKLFHKLMMQDLRCQKYLRNLVIEHPNKVQSLDLRKVHKRAPKKDLKRALKKVPFKAQWNPNLDLKQALSKFFYLVDQMKVPSKKLQLVHLKIQERSHQLNVHPLVTPRPLRLLNYKKSRKSRKTIKNTKKMNLHALRRML